MSESKRDQEIRPLLSAYLDGELTQADRQRVRLYLESSEECRRELEELAKVKQLTAELRFQGPPDELMDELERRLAVRGPRRLGWGLLCAALAVLTIYLVVSYVQHFQWPGNPLEWLAIAALGGILLVFLSVLWQRLLERPYDRYRKVKR